MFGKEAHCRSIIQGHFHLPPSNFLQIRVPVVNSLNKKKHMTWPCELRKGTKLPGKEFSFSPLWCQFFQRQPRFTMFQAVYLLTQVSETRIHLYSKHPDIRCMGFSFHPTTNSLILQYQLSVLQFSSDTDYPKLASDSTGFKTPSHKTAQTSDTRHKYGVPRLPTLLSDLATNHRFPWPLSSQVWKFAINKWLSELRGMFYLILPVFYKGYKWTSKWRNTEGKVWKCPEYRSFFWPQGFCSIPPSWHMDAVSNPEALWISVFCFCCAMQFVGS